MNISLRRIEERTVYPFRIARPYASVQGRSVRRIIVRIKHHGAVGFGEAAPTEYYRQSLDTVETVIEQIAADPGILGDDLFQIGPIVERLLDRFDDHRAAVAAVDQALHDWVGRKLAVPIWRILGLDANLTPATSMTIGIDEPSTIAERIERAHRFETLKIKVGTEHDEETLEIVRRCAPEKQLRLDANGAWSPDEALTRIAALERFRPALIEQPIPAGNLTALRDIHERSAIPIYADEDCIRPDDLRPLAGCVAGVNIKLAKCGGIREALRMISWAHALNLNVMLGCMVETSLGISAASHIATLADLIDLDGHLLIENEPFNALRLDGDRVIPTDQPGIGVDAGFMF